MKSQMKMVAAALLAASLVGSYAYAGAPPPPPKKKQVAKKPPKPTVEDQINALRQEFQGQIDTLKSDLAAKDAQLKQAQQTANDAQAAAQKAQADATAQQSALTENAAAVSTLQSTVTDMKTVNATVVSSLTDEATSIKKSIASPDVLHYKGITISPAGSFLAAETVWRSGATGGDINTPFTGIPLDHAEAAGLSEFFGSGRQSRLAIKAIGKLDNVTMTGYYEMDFLSAGVTSNNNQSNSYTLRQRQLWADAKLHDGWDFSGGQGWSLATETTQGLTRGSEILPATVDAQYTAGFVWARQYSFRVSKDLSKKFFAGASLENAETLNPAGQNLPTNLLIGSPGVGGGLYNLNANYSFNMTPDFVAKSWSTPAGATGNSSESPAASAIASILPPAHHITTQSGAAALAAACVVAWLTKKSPLDSRAFMVMAWVVMAPRPSLTSRSRPNADISPLHGFSALSTVELNPNPRLMVYLNYGGDYIGRDYAITPAGTHVGYGTYTTNMTGCNVEVKSTGSFNPAAPSNCGANNKDVQEFTAGYWYNMYSGPKGRLRYGLQYACELQRNLWSARAALRTRAAEPRVPTTCSGPRSVTYLHKPRTPRKERRAVQFGLPFFFLDQS